MTPSVDLRVPGPPGHGAVRHAGQLAVLLAAAGLDVGDRDAEVTHTQFTDALWGADAAGAAAAFAAWAGDRPRPLVVTLHDLPGGDPDPARDARRCAAYHHVVQAADAVVVSSGHEADRVARLGAAATVIPLPLPRLAPATSTDELRAVGVLGWVYPGKGHAEAIDLAAAHGLAVHALGAVAPGHAALAAQLADRARARGVAFVVSGPLGEAAFATAAATVTVPVSLHEQASASASLLVWLAAGRRPLVRADPYSLEIERRHPGSLHPASERSVARALRAPGWTRGPVPAWPDVAALHTALYHRLLA